MIYLDLEVSPAQLGPESERLKPPWSSREDSLAQSLPLESSCPDMSPETCVKRHLCTGYISRDAELPAPVKGLR